MGPVVSEWIRMGFTERGRNVDALEGGDAGSLGIQDIICGWKTKIVSGEVKGDVR